MVTSKIIGHNFKHTAGSIWNELGRAAAHGLTNGTLRVIQGGKFEHGFLSGFVSSLGGSFMQAYGGNMYIGTQVALSAAIGGTAEALGGGKFANGAITGAYVGLFNHAMHQTQARHLTAEMRREIYFESYIEFREHMKSLGVELSEISETYIEGFFNDLSEKIALLPNESVAGRYGAQQDLLATISTVHANVMNNETGNYIFKNPLFIGNSLQPESGKYFSYKYHIYKFPRIVIPINSKHSLEFRIQWKVDPEIP